MDSNQKTTLNAVLAVTVVILLAGVGYFSFAKKSTPTAQPATLPAAQQPEEPFTFINIDDLKSLAICGITVKVPSFVNMEINKDNDYAPNGEYDKATGCRYGTSDYGFSVLVWDKNNVAPPSRDLLWQARIKAFDQYQQINDVNSIKNFSASDIISTSIKSENLYKKINNNSVGYTAEIFQDFPGSGVYQTLTEVDDRYLVYLTYGLFSRADKAWQDYFNKRYSFEKKNQEQIFKEYMALNLNLAAITDKIYELNSIAGAVK